MVSRRWQVRVQPQSILCSTLKSPIIVPIVIPLLGVYLTVRSLDTCTECILQLREGPLLNNYIIINTETV